MFDDDADDEKISKDIHTFDLDDEEDKDDDDDMN